MDDCWSVRNRTADGKLQADPNRFPSGIAGLAKYVIPCLFFPIVFLGA
jgi:alpha-galactosidase